MKHLYLLLSLFLPFHLVVAQTLTLGTISKSVYCLGDTVWVPYSSSGSFAADNFFTVQLSDATGSFTTFTNIGHKTTTMDSIPIVIGYAGNQYRVRVIATDPYTISTTTSSHIQIANFPSPNPLPNVFGAFIGSTRFVGDLIQFRDASVEASGSSYTWKFDQDASVIWSTTPSPSVSYSSAGLKTGSLTVSNISGCSTIRTFQLRVLSCSPIIPETAHIVTGTESGNFPEVWVKAGGNYTVNRDFSNLPNNTVFVDAGSSVQIGDETSGIYYVKNGASFAIPNLTQPSIVVMTRGNSITFEQFERIDTLYCDNLQFDYSRVGGADVPVAENPLHILNSPNHLQVRNDGAVISTSIVNLLGTTILSKTERDLLSLDLSALPDGVYFAIVESGNHREMRKIVVMH